MKKCPFNKFKLCIGEDCELYREEGRVKDQTNEHVMVKGCALSFAPDHSWNLTRKISMLQSEMGEVKNAAVLQALATLTDAPEAKNALRRMVKKNHDLLL